MAKAWSRTTAVLVAACLAATLVASCGEDTDRAAAPSGARAALPQRVTAPAVGPPAAGANSNAGSHGGDDGREDAPPTPVGPPGETAVPRSLLTAMAEVGATLTVQWGEATRQAGVAESGAGTEAGDGAGVAAIESATPSRTPKPTRTPRPTKTLRPGAPTYTPKPTKTATEKPPPTEAIVPSDTPAPQPTAPPPTAEPTADTSVLGALREGGHVIYLRHTLTDWGQNDRELEWINDDKTVDPGLFADCDRQRLLSGEGRDQARAIGEAFRRLDIPVGQVLTSRWCRTRETADLAFGKGSVSAGKLFDTGYLDDNSEDRKRYRDELRSLMSDRPGRSNRVIVGHMPQLYDVTGIQLEEAEAAIFRPDGSGFALLVDHIGPGDWDGLAGR
ncbi:MAG: hypothetical protein ACK2T6_00170 [Anaerolineae bacterium]